MLKYLFLLVIALMAVDCFGQQSVTVDDRDLMCHSGDTIEAESLDVSRIELLSPDGYDTAGDVTFDYKTTKYWDKYLTYRKAGWICLGVGAGCFIGGYALICAAWGSDHESLADVSGVTGIIMMASSPILIATSVPLLSIAYYNRSRAKHAKIDVGMTSIPSPDFARDRFSAPAVSLALRF